jgi:hypothetical protein
MHAIRSQHFHFIVIKNSVDCVKGKKQTNKKHIKENKMKYIYNYDMFCSANTYGQKFHNHKVYVNLTSIPVLLNLLIFTIQ